MNVHISTKKMKMKYSEKQKGDERDTLADVSAANLTFFL